MAVINFYNDLFSEKANSFCAKKGEALDNLIKNYVATLDDYTTQEIYNIKTGKTEYIATPCNDYKVLVLLNGEELENYDYLIKEEDVITVIFIPQSEEAENIGMVISNILAASAMAVGSLLTVTGIGAPVGAIMMALGAAHIFGNAIWAGVDSYWDARVASTEKGYKAETALESEANLSLSGGKNQSILDKRFPIVMGRNLMNPFVIGSPYTNFTTKTLAGNDDGQYITILYCLGYRPLRITDIKIGEITACYNRKVDTILKDENEINVYHGLLKGVSENTLDDGDILRKWKNNDLSIEIIQNGKDFSTLYPQVVEEIEPGANIIKIEDGIIEEVASTHYKGVSIPDGYQTNSVRFSHSCPSRIEVDIEFPNGLYATRTKKEDNKSKICYYGLPVNMAVQWRFVKKGQASSDPNDFKGWKSFSKIEIDRNDSLTEEEVYATTRSVCEKVFECNSNLGKSGHYESLLQTNPTETETVINNDMATGQKLFCFGNELTAQRSAISSSSKPIIYGSRVVYEWVYISAKDYKKLKDKGYQDSVIYPKSIARISTRPENQSFWNPSCSVYGIKKTAAGYFGADGSGFEIQVTDEVLYSKIRIAKPDWNTNGETYIKDPYVVTREADDKGYYTSFVYYAIKGNIIEITNASIFDLPLTLEDDEWIQKDLGFTVQDMINARRFTVSYDFTEDDIKTLLTDKDIEMDSVEVRVIRITPNYLDETGDQEGDWSNVHYEDLSKWTKLRTFVFDKEKVKHLIEEGTSFAPSDYPLCPIISKDIEKFTFLALKMKQDVAQTGGSQLNELSCIVQNYVPYYDKDEDKWLPETISYNTEKKRTDVVDYFDSQILFNEDKNRYFMPQDVVDRFATANTASQWVNLLTNSYLGLDAKTYDNLDMINLTEFYKFCEDVTDGTPYDSSTGYEDKGDGLLHIKFECNGIINNNQKLETVLQNIALTGRATIGRNEVGKYRVFIGKPTDYPVAVLNQRNVISRQNTRSFEECPSGFEMPFIDESDNYTQNTIYAMDDNEDIEAPSKETESLSYSYVTNKYQLLSLGRFNLACRKHEVETYKATVGAIGHTFTIGDKVLLQDSSLVVGTDNGARIAELIEDDDYIYGFIADDAFTYSGNITEDGLCIEGVMIMQAGLYNESRCVTLRLATTDGITTQDGTILKSQRGLTNKIILANPIIKETHTSSEHITSSDYCTLKPEIGDLLAFGEVGQITIEASITSIEPQENDTFDISLVPYIDEIYNYGTTLPVFTSNMSKPSRMDNEIGFSSSITNAQIEDSVNMTNITTSYIEKNVDEKISEALSDVGIDTSIGDITSANAVLIEHEIQIKLNIDYDNFVGNIKNFIYELSTDNGATYTEIKRVNSDIYNYPLPNADRYKEKDYFVNWKLRVKVQSQYDTYSENWYEFEVDTSEYGTWIPPQFESSQVIAIANEQGININLNNKFPTDVKLYGSYNTIVEFSRDGETWQEVEDNYISFDRDIDGYPEKEDLATYKIRVHRKSYLVDHTIIYTEKFVDTTNYGTWIPLQPNIKTSVSGRTININLEQPQRADGLQPYGVIKYKVQVKRVTPIEDSEYYCPTLSLNPYDSEDNYKDITSDNDYVLVTNNFRQTMPLSGQNETEPLPVDTMYKFKITTVNLTTNIEVEPLETGNITALATSVKDIVAGAITTTKLADNCVTVDKLAVDTLVADESFMNELTSNVVNTGKLTFEVMNVKDFGYIVGNEEIITYKYTGNDNEEHSYIPEKGELFFGSGDPDDASRNFIKLKNEEDDDSVVNRNLYIEAESVKARNVEVKYDLLVKSGFILNDIENYFKFTPSGFEGVMNYFNVSTKGIMVDDVINNENIINITPRGNSTENPYHNITITSPRLHITGDNYFIGSDCFSIIKKDKSINEFCLYSPTISNPTLSGGNISITATTINNKNVTSLLSHFETKGNPHGLTPNDLGITVINNTADENKSVKYAATAQAANYSTEAKTDVNGNDITSYTKSPSLSTNIVTTQSGATAITSATYKHLNLLLNKTDGNSKTTNMSNVNILQSAYSTNSGYVKFANGLIIQWGKMQLLTTSAYSCPFLITFTSLPTLTLVPVRYTDDGAPQGDMRVRKLTTTEFKCEITNDDKYTTQSYAHWIAIGY